MSNYNYRTLTRKAKPRNDATLDAAYLFRGKGGNTIAGEGSSFTGYWTLVTTDDEGNALAEEDYYIITKYNAASQKGLSAYGFMPGSVPQNGGGEGLTGFDVVGSGPVLTDGSYADGKLTLTRGEQIYLPVNNAANGNGCLQFMQMSSQNAAGDLPNSDWYSVLKMNHGDGDAYYNRAIAFHFFSNAIYTRRRTNGSAYGWVKLLSDEDISSSSIANWNAAYSNSHTHANKGVLDGISSTLINNWNTAYTMAHSHANKALLDVINQNLSTSGNPTFATYVQIGTIRLAYDSANNAIYVLKSDGTAANFYALGGISAYGYNGGGSVENNYYLTGVSGSGNGIVTFTRQGLGSLTWNASHSHNIALTTNGSGNVVSNVTVSGLTITVTKSTLSSGGGISAISSSVSGSGNGITSLSASGSVVYGTKGYFYNAINTSGSGNVITGVTANGGTLTFTKGTIAGGGAMTKIQQYYGSSLSLTSTITSNGVIRTGYLNGMSGSIANGGFNDVGICWSVTSSNCLGVAVSIQRPNADIGGITVTWRWQGGGLQFTVHNRSGGTLSLSSISISFVAVCSS